MKKLISVALTGAVAATAHAAEFKLPAFETAKLPNGLTVYMMERHDVPLVAVLPFHHWTFDHAGLGLHEGTGAALVGDRGLG